MTSISLLCAVRAVSRVLAAAMLCCAGAVQADVRISDGQTRHMSCSAGVCTPKAAIAILNVTDLANMLAVGDVKVVSDSTAKDIDFKAPLSWTSTSRLTLDSYRFITVEQPVTVVGTGALTLNSGQGDSSGAIAYVKKGHFTFWDLSSNVVVGGTTYSLVNSVSMLASTVASDSFGNYALANDYDASLDGTYSKSPIVEFYGYAEGLGNTISNIIMRDSTAGDNVGLFAFTGQESQIAHFHLAGARVTGGSGTHVGALVGQAYGTLDHDSVSGGGVKTADSGYAGALVGDVHGGYLRYCEASANVSSGHSSRAGGLVGNAAGYGILYSAASGDVTIVDGMAGGLAGDGSSEASYSHASGNVTATGGNSAVGGLEGISYEIENSYATGEITAGENSKAGGLVGSAGTTRTSYAAGSVTVMGPKGVAGGLVGQTDGPTVNSYATGAVKAKDAGGLIGLYISSAYIYGSYSTGKVTGGSNSGGLAGFAQNGAGDMTSSYWDLETSRISDPSQAAGNIANYPGARAHQRTI